MPRKTPPRLAAVAAADRPFTLRLTWADGAVSSVDISRLVTTFKLYRPLRDDPTFARAVRLGEHGVDVVWDDDIDMSADTLWRLAREQSGATLSAEGFRHWRESRAFTLEAAADALGLSRRTVAYYEQGKRPVPRVVALATRGLESERAAR